MYESKCQTFCTVHCSLSKFLHMTSWLCPDAGTIRCCTLTHGSVQMQVLYVAAHLLMPVSNCIYYMCVGSLHKNPVGRRGVPVLPPVNPSRWLMHDSEDKRGGWLLTSRTSRSSDAELHRWHSTHRPPLFKLIIVLTLFPPTSPFN